MVDSNVDKEGKLDDIELVLSLLSKDDLVRLQSRIIDVLGKKFGLGAADVLQLRPGGEFNIFVPVTVFSTVLSPSEALVKFLKDEFNLGFSVIADLLNKDASSVWSSFQRANSKVGQGFKFGSSKLLVPVNAFKIFGLSVLECLVLHLVDVKRLKIAELSIILKKDKSTLWTAYNRAKKKLEAAKR